jgi:hypothetical protein
LEERLVRNEEAAGSSPAPSTNLFRNLHCFPKCRELRVRQVESLTDSEGRRSFQCKVTRGTRLTPLSAIAPACLQ